MNNSDKYRFDDFTLSNYERLLKIAKEKYNFTSYTEYIYEKSNYIILRHDLEFSPPLALKMAKIENKLGIKSTVFVNIHSEYYNCFEKRTYNIINEIKELGHSIELHLDAHFYNIHNEDGLNRSIEMEKNVFRDFFHQELNAFSFHNTTPNLLTYNKDKYSGLTNAYSSLLKSIMNYCADSTGYWRYEVIEDLLLDSNTEKLQLLIHDGMWQDEVLPPRQRVFKVIDDRAMFLKDKYDRILKHFGAKNIDWNKIY